MMDPADFEQQLVRDRQDYQLLSPLGANVCQLRFTGPFLGQHTIWDATVQTLAYYVSRRTPQDRHARQFIAVGEAGVHGRHIEIGLNVPVIDAPVIRKTLIMVRQYKRLAVGRHEFGERLNFPT